MYTHFYIQNQSVKKHTGFTLVELLVVIAIIGVLATVLTTALSESRINARNTARVSQAQEFQKALELYYVDNERYPCAQSDDCSYTGSGGQENFNADWPLSAARTLQNVGYLTNTPPDPLFGTATGDAGCNSVDATGYCYCGGTDQYPDSYVVTVELENADRCAIQFGSDASNLCTAHQAGLASCTAI